MSLCEVCSSACEIAVLYCTGQKICATFTKLKKLVLSVIGETVFCHVGFVGVVGRGHCNRRLIQWNWLWVIAYGNVCHVIKDESDVDPWQGHQGSIHPKKTLSLSVPLS